MPRPTERPIEMNYAYLSKDAEAGNQFANEVMRLAPRLAVPYDASSYAANYFRPIGGLDLVVRAFIIDFDMKPFPSEDRPRFALGFTASLLEALTDEYAYTDASPRQEIEALTIEGGTLDVWAARALGLEHRANKNAYPLRLNASVGEQDVLRTGDSHFPDIVAAKAIINSFYIRYGVRSLTPDDAWDPNGYLPGGQKNIVVVEVPDIAVEVPDFDDADEETALAGPKYVHISTDAPDTEPEPEPDGYPQE